MLHGYAWLATVLSLVLSHVTKVLLSSHARVIEPMKRQTYKLMIDRSTSFVLCKGKLRNDIEYQTSRLLQVLICTELTASFAHRFVLLQHPEYKAEQEHEKCLRRQDRRSLDCRGKGKATHQLPLQPGLVQTCQWTPPLHWSTS